MSNELKLTSELLLAAVEEIERRQETVDAYRRDLRETYGDNAALLVNEVIEQRTIERDAKEWGDGLIRSADLPDDED